METPLVDSTDSSTKPPKPKESRAASYASPPTSYLGRSEYISSIVPIDEEDARKYHVEHDSAAPSEAYQKFLHELRAFDLPPRSVRDSLITNFLERCHPWMPIVDNIAIDRDDTPETSLLLLQAIFVAGSKVSTAPNAQCLGEEFYRRAKALYYSDFEKDPLVVIQAICLLQWWNPSGAEHISRDASTFWLHMGVALAHQIGLHRDPSPSQPNAGFRRRLWWTLFTRDCMISASHGRPRAISKKDFDVRPPTLEDFPGDKEDARLFMTYVEISAILGDLTEHSFRGTLGRSSRTSIEHRLFCWMSELPAQFHLHDRRTGRLCPYNFKARQLHIPYFTALSILFRPTVMDTPPSVAPVLSSSFVVGIYEEFLARGEIPLLAPVFIFHLLAAALAEVACHNYPLLWAKTEKEFKVINQALDEFSHRFPSALGAQRVVKGVTAAVQKQQSQRPSFELSVSEKQFQFFDFFGPDLCSKWDLVYGLRYDSQRKNEISYDMLRYPSAPARMSNDANEINLNTNGFTASRSFNLQDQKNSSSTIAPSPQPLAGNESGFIAVEDLRPLSTDPSGLPFSTSSLIDPVGNWMLNDWMTDLTYWDSIPNDP
ncbi:C6 transcription factor [Blastomyces gilchristii SLH14081]|uniref:C6 transcription factor n=1 Tax=Blastomyces gilchristii (strain SLH14081) TaxID=559298 RepID=A0A179UUA8_BLAGS|nr:C6 transcription factor [Blastomyces gilchristii SLH14081]EQL35447.1 hypothetical protein BDFG_02931 [Blastomyces dermatitidis ATCC 26199]OAT11624.1 C6 transcription factor [Blastomyces gilchristii SLH14081]